MLIHTAARAAYTALSRRAGRARIGTHDSVTRLRSVLASLAARVNGDRATAAAYLAQVGADDDTIRRYASQLGKRATALLREQGAEPQRDGLAVVTRHGHPGLVEVNTYPVAVLAAAAKAYGNTSHLTGAAPMETPTATIDPAALAVEISDRHFERTGHLAKTCRAYVARRVADIVEGMARTRENYDPTTGLLTDAGAALVTQIISTDAATGLAWREIGQMVDAAALVGASQ